MVNGIPDPTLVSAKMLEASAMSAEKAILSAQNGAKA